MSPLPVSAPVQPAPVPGRWWRLAVWACLLVCAALQIGRTPFTADLSAFLPAHPDARQRVLIEQLQSGVAARTLLMAIEGGDSLTRAQASRDLAAALRASGLFEQVQNGQKDGFAEVGTFLFENRYLLSAAVDAQRFTAEGLRQGLLESLSLLGTPAGLLVKPLFERDPTGETLRVGEALVPSSAPRSEHGVWVSRPEASSLPRALLVATSKAAGADLDSQLRAIEAVRQAFTRLQAASSAAVARGEGVAATSGPPLVLRISGAPLFSVESRARIETEVHLLALAGTVLMSAVLLLAFGSLKALGVALLPVLTGVVGGIVAVSLTFGSVHGITLGFGATLIGEAVDYAIYYLMQARAGGWRAWLRDGWPTVRLGLLTSVCGFAALVFSGFPGLAQLGVFSVAGLVSAVLFMRLVLPALAPDGAAQGGLRRALGLASRRLLSQLPGLRVPLLLLGALALLLVVYQRDRIWEAELGSLSPVSQEALALDASLRADLSAGDASVLVVVRGANLQTTLQAAEEAALQLDRLVEQGAIGGYNSVARWLPSLQTQQRRQASLPEAAALKSALVAATAGLPLSAERLGPFVADVQSARSRTLESLRGTPLASLAEALLLQRADGSWTALLPLQPLLDAAPGQELDMAAVNKTFQLARPAGPPSTAAPAAAGAEQAQVRSQDALQVIEIGAELKRLYSRYLSEARDQALLGALAVVVLMAFTLRSLPRLLAVCLPLFWAVLLTLGVLVALQVPLGILHLVGLLLVVAVGSNYALFFDMVQQQGQADDDLLASLVLANATTVLGFGLIALSSIPALSAVGRVVAPGALLALLLAAAFIPSRVQPLAQKQHG
jgi:predicted exporter